MNEELLRRIEYALMGWVLWCPEYETVEVNTLIFAVREQREFFLKGESKWK